MSKPFPYQLDGASFLAGKNHALLGDEMGLGKTAQAILGLEHVRAGKVLIVCPSVARVNWLREFKDWATTDRDFVIPFKISDRPRATQSVICSFDYALANVDILRQEHWDALIVDECHFLKNHTAKRSAALMGKRGLIRAAARTWLLSGTPAPNHAGELWILLYTFGATPLKYDAFVDRFCITSNTSYGIKIHGTNTARIPELRQLLKKIMLRRLKKDVMKQLPPISYQNCLVEPGPVDVEILPSFTHYMIPVDRRDELKDEITRQAELLNTVYTNMKPKEVDKLAAMQSIWDSVSILRRYVGLQKCRDAIEHINNIFINKHAEKIVIFAIHRDVIETLRVGLRKHGAVCLYGGTDPKKRQKNIDRFQNNPKCKIFIGNISAAGTAITLTAAHHVFFVEQDWVPGNNAQAVMRCHRIGQENPVTVKFFALADSLDSHIMFLVKKKTMELTQIFD